MYVSFFAALQFVTLCHSTIGPGHFTTVNFERKSSSPPPTASVPKPPSVPLNQFLKDLEVKSPDHSYAKTNGYNPYSEICELRTAFNAYKEQSVRQIHNLKAQVKYFRSVIRRQREGNLPKSTETIVVRKALKRKRNMTDGELDFYLSETPRKRSNNWNYDDIRKGAGLLCISSKGTVFENHPKSLILQH